MSAKPVIPRERAQRDIEEAIDRYAREAGTEVAMSFVHDVEQAFMRIADHPASGSPRYAYELRIADLRGVRLKRYPYLVFYIERPDHVDVWRVLHGKQDIPV